MPCGVFAIPAQKPTKFGIRVWVNSEAKSGYVLNFQIYTGSNEKTKEKGLAYRVVMDLMEPYFHKGHCLFIDNFYTGVQLLIDLVAKGTYCAGTARSNRKFFPAEIIPAKEKGTQVEPGNFCFAVGIYKRQEQPSRSKIVLVIKTRVTKSSLAWVWILVTKIRVLLIKITR